MKNKNSSNQNALKHGIFAQVLLKSDAFGEDREEFIRLGSILQKSIRPVGGFEEMLVEKLAVLLFRLLRLYRADLKIAPKMFKRVAEFLGPGQPSVKATWVSREDQVVFMQRDPSSESLMRYEANLERQIARTFGQIEASQQLRGGNSTPALLASELDAPEVKHEAVS
jgi:hypothetical protein